MVPLGDVPVTGHPCAMLDGRHIPTHAECACKLCSFLTAFSKGVYVPMTSITENQALHGHQGTHTLV